MPFVTRTRSKRNLALPDAYCPEQDRIIRENATHSDSYIGELLGRRGFRYRTAADIAAYRLEHDLPRPERNAYWLRGVGAKEGWPKVQHPGFEEHCIRAQTRAYEAALLAAMLEEIAA